MGEHVPGDAGMSFSRMEKVVLITSSIIFSLFFVYIFYRVSESDILRLDTGVPSSLGPEFGLL